MPVSTDVEYRPLMQVRPDKHPHQHWRMTGPGCDLGVLITTSKDGWTSQSQPDPQPTPWMFDRDWANKLWQQRSIAPTDNQGKSITWVKANQESVYLDLAGNPLEMGGYIVYAATWGRSSVLKYGIITRRTFAPPCNYRAEPNTPKIGVITVDRCSWKDPEVWEVQKNGQEQILGYLDRMLVLDAGQVPIEARTALCDAFDKWHQHKIKANGGGHGQGNG